MLRSGSIIYILFILVYQDIEYSSLCYNRTLLFICILISLNCKFISFNFKTMTLQQPEIAEFPKHSWLVSWCEPAVRCFLVTPKHIPWDIANKEAPMTRDCGEAVYPGKSELVCALEQREETWQWLCQIQGHIDAASLAWPFWVLHIKIWVSFIIKARPRHLCPLTSAPLCIPLCVRGTHFLSQSVDTSFQLRHPEEALF